MSKKSKVLPMTPPGGGMVRKSVPLSDSDHFELKSLEMEAAALQNKKAVADEIISSYEMKMQMIQAHMHAIARRNGAVNRYWHNDKELVIEVPPEKKKEEAPAEGAQEKEILDALDKSPETVH